MKYMYYHFIFQDKEVISDPYKVQHSVLRQPFNWQPKVSDVAVNSTRTHTCRNSVQGKTLIVDERGKTKCWLECSILIQRNIYE